MSRSFLLATVGAVGLLSVPVAAAASPCVTTTLDLILATANPTFSCTVGNLTFSNFSYAPDGTGVPAMNIGVAPDTILGLPGLQFNGFYNNTTTANEDALLIFTVTAPTALITDFHLQLDGAVGAVDDTATLTSSGSSLSTTLSATDNSLQTLNLLTTTPPGPFQNLTVQDDIGLSPGGRLSSIHKGFSEVPGPVVGAGLPGLIAACGGLMFLARRRRTQAIA
jgi:hypothetical protein